MVASAKRKRTTKATVKDDTESTPSKRRSSRNLKSRYFEAEETEEEENDDVYEEKDEDISDYQSDVSSPGANKLPRLKKTTVNFLRELAANNDREWFHENSEEHKAAYENFKGFIEVLSEKIIEKDSTIPELPLKDLLFRVHRDIRFSNDKTPYKTYFAAAWSRTGKKGPYAAYYLSIQPGSSFIGGGLWHCEAQPVSLMRRDIDRHPHRIRRVLGNRKLFENFYQEQPENAAAKKGKKGRVSTATQPTPNDRKEREKKMLKSFLQRNGEDALKTAPKDYDKTHKDIELLRLKSFTLGKRLTDEEIMGPYAITTIADLVGALAPFINYLNDVVMPDINAPPYNQNDDDSNEEDEEEDEEDEEDEDEED